jgi:adenine-specific DNA-methyltransferase
MPENIPNEPEKLDLASLDIAAQKRDELAMLFPEARTEGGKIDFEKLKAVLGEAVDAGRERYGMNWPGKSECMRTIQAPSMGTLLPMPEASVEWDASENVIIEGDNLEVLKLLQKSYLGKVKMIYIDPPYNTGKEFIYPDNYTESLQTYLEYSGQVDTGGRKFGSNTETDGRYHSKWLSMMYSRLFLARQLLRDDGVIFMSIDDNEVSNLRKLCDEIFGEENFITDIIWEKRFTRNNDAKLSSSVVDHILLYRKSDDLSRLREGRTEKSNSIYSNPDNDERGPWTSVSYISQRTRAERPNLSYKIVNPQTGNDVEHPVNAWKYSKEQYELHARENRLYWGRSGENEFPRLKRFLGELSEGIVPVNLWNYKETGTIDDGTKIVDALIGKDVFDYPKPPSLIRRMLGMVCKDDGDIVLDFFAGSGTTGHAVLEQNEDGVRRSFVLVQLPEPADKGPFQTISEITRARVKAVIENLRSAPSTLTSNERELGFRAFKLAPSNFIPWDGTASNDAAQLAKQLQLGIEHTRDDRTPDDLLYEILLKSWGEPALSLKVAEETIEGLRVFSVANGLFFICLEETVSLEFIRAVASRKPDRVVMRESAFAGNDQLKTNAVQTFKSQGVTSFKVV